MIDRSLDSVKKFLKWGQRARKRMARHPVLFGLVGGIAIVLFWRGVWNLSDTLEAQGGILGHLFSSSGSIIISVIVLLGTGLFVSFFVGDIIIMSDVSKESKMVKKTEDELKVEEAQIRKVEEVLRHVEEEVAHLHEEHKSKHHEKPTDQGHFDEKAGG